MKYYILAACTLLFVETALAEVEGFKFECDANAATFAKQYLGKWQVEWTYRTAPGEYANSAATSRITGAPGVCGIREFFEGIKKDTDEDIRDVPYFYEWTTSSLQTANREAVWLDSAHGGFLHYTSVEGSEQWPIRFVWSHQNGRLKTRFQYSDVTDGSFTIERHLSSDSGQSWALTSNSVYKPYNATAAKHRGHGR